MPIETYLAFLAATAVVILIPGPSVMLTVAHSLAHGSRQAMVTVAGTMAAIVLQLAVTAAGMNAFMLLLADWFEWLRWAGVAYLLYIGIRQWRAVPLTLAEQSRVKAPLKKLFWQGFVVSASNPKTLFFYAAFFPQFVDPAASTALQMAILCPSFLIVASVLTAGYAVLAGGLRGWFGSRSRVLWRNRVSGSLMIGAGLGLALARRA